LSIAKTLAVCNGNTELKSRQTALNAMWAHGQVLP
jgi:hypothetical protein